MWFKNLRVFRLTEPFTTSPEELNTALEKYAFKPCGSLDPVKFGWVFPLGREGQEYIHVANGYIMLCAKRQEKVLPSAVIKEALEEKIAEISSAEHRHVGRAERETLKDEIIFSLMPKALAKSSLLFAYIDTQHNYVVINTSSATRAEELLSALREALGTLKVLPLTPINPAVNTMTQWVRSEKAPKNFAIGEECELGSSREGRVIRCKHQDLGAEEIGMHIDSGLLVTKLALSWKDAITCIVDEQLAIKRIKYEDAIIEKADDHHAETKAEQFDIDFSIMTLEISAFLRDIGHAFGGIETESS